MLNNGYYSNPINRLVNRRWTCACLILLLCVSMVLSGCSRYSSAIGVQGPPDASNLNRMINDQIVTNNVNYTDIYGNYTVEEGKYWLYLADTDQGEYGIIECAIVNGKYVFPSLDILPYDWLTDDYSDYMYQSINPITTHIKNSNIVYCVFTNPSIDTVNVSGNTVDVEKYTVDLYGEKVDVGMWSLILPEDSDIVVE